MRLLIDPNVQPVVHDGIRWYPISGEWLPSVTSVLSATDIEGGNLTRWKERKHGESEAEHLHRTVTMPTLHRDRGAERGHQLNDEIEQWCIDRRLPTSTWGQSVHGVLCDIQEVYGRELPIVHPELRVASRLDIACDYMTRPTIIDWKTARRPKRREWIANYEQQVALYVRAVGFCYPDFPRIDRGAVIIALEQWRLRCPSCEWESTLTYESDCPQCLMPTDTVWRKARHCQRIHLDPSEIDDAFDRFAERCSLFWATHEPPEMPLPEAAE